MTFFVDAPEGADVTRRNEGMSMTRSAAALSSPFYMSPEQILEPATVDAMTDVWAVGVVLFEMITGRPPFDDQDVRALCLKHLRDPVPEMLSPHGPLPDDLVKIVERAMSKTPAQRFPNMRAMRAELDAVARIVEHLGGRVPVQPPPSAVGWSRFLWDSLDRHRLGAIAAWNMSETAATGTLEAIVEAGRRYDLPDVVRAYEQIIKDEKFHVGLGRLLLDRYIENDDDLAEVMRAMRGMAVITVESHVAIDPG